jgi:hypothetical protein
MTVLWQRGAGEWVGPVHEYLNVAAHRTAIAFRIGQSPAKAKDPLRNLRILRRSDLRRPRHQFYLGRELYERGRFAEAIAWLTVYLQNGQFLAEVAEAHLTIARCHWQLQQGDRAAGVPPRHHLQSGFRRSDPLHGRPPQRTVEVEMAAARRGRDQ